MKTVTIADVLEVLQSLPPEAEFKVCMDGSILQIVDIDDSCQIQNLIEMNVTPLDD